MLAFSDSAQSELLRLEDGDAVSVQGALRAEAYQKDGEPRASLTVMAAAVLPLRPAAKKREQPARERDEKGSAPFDAMPF